MRKNSSNWKRFFLTIGAVLFFFETTIAQGEKKSPITWSALIDLYYGYDFNQPKAESRLPFLYNHTRHHSPSVNLALLSGSF